MCTQPEDRSRRLRALFAALCIAAVSACPGPGENPGLTSPSPSLTRPTVPNSGPFDIKNLDGPPVQVVPWTGAAVISVACGNTVSVDVTNAPQRPWHVIVRNATSGAILLDAQAQTGDRFLVVRRDGAFLTTSGFGGPPVTGRRCG